MPDPVIKREPSLTPEISTTMSRESTLVNCPDSRHSSEDVKPPQPKSQHATEMVKGDLSSASRLFTDCLLTFAQSSQQGPAIATGRVNKAANASTITTPTTATIGRFEQHFGLANTYLDSRSANMANQGFGEDFQLFPPTASNSPEHIGDSVIVSRRDLERLENHVNQLFNASAATHHQIASHNTVIRELVTFNRNSHTYVQQLNARIMQLEAQNTHPVPTVPHGSSRKALHNPNFADNEQQISPVTGPDQYRNDAEDHSQSPSPTANRYRNRGGHSVGAALKTTTSGRVTKSKVRKQLNITIPSSLAVPAIGAGLLTPMTKTATSIPSGTFGPTSSLTTPITPGRIGPLNFNHRSKPRTKRVSRGTHNLDRTMAPIYAQIPLVPLTDTEVIVYFFQSIARPLISLRLYARNWGPASIVDVLHDHRQIDPPYLRNTCSVKCTTAIKKGKEMYGDEWEDTYRVIFASADDLKATDLIRLTTEEIENARDFDIRQLCVGLKKHPLEGVDGGIFTRCVKYVEEHHDAEYTLENVWQLASDLQAGRLPGVAETVSDKIENSGPSQESKTTETPSSRSESPGSDASGLSTESESVIGDDSASETDEST